MKVVKTLLFIIICIILILIGLSYAGVLPFNIQSLFVTTIDIDIYTNNQLVASDQISSIDYPTLKKGIIPFKERYENFYGQYLIAECFVNDEKGICFTDDNDENLIIANKNNMIPMSIDHILINIYYMSIEKPTDKEIEYGIATLQIETKYPVSSYQDYSVSFIGDKDGNTISKTYNFNNNGIIIAQLDMSYQWIYYFEGSNWIIKFDDDNYYYNGLTVEEISTAPDPLVIDELPEEHEVYIYWEYVNDTTNTVINSEASFSAYAGEVLDLDFYMRHPPGTALLEGDTDIIIEINGEMYKLIAISKSGGNENSNWPLVSDAPIDEFPMINDDLMITFHYEYLPA